MSVLTRHQGHWARAVAAGVALVVTSGCGGESEGPTPTATEHVLRVQGTGVGSGTVTAPSASPQLSCSITAGTAVGACTIAYRRNSTVQLVATPNAESTFDGWSGACRGTVQCVVGMSQDRTVMASFGVSSVLMFTLSLTLSGQGTGTVSSSPGGIGCQLIRGSVSGQCNATFSQGTDVTLTASIPTGSSFGGWGGACAPSGTRTTCTVFMGQPHIATATFALASSATR